MKTTELVRISVFPSVADAQIAQGVLDGAGIESMIQSDNAGGMYPALDAVALLVRPEDVAAAEEVMKDCATSPDRARAPGSARS